MKRKVIITGDDFGFSPAVNEAVEEAHTRGVLNTASLMVGAPDAPDAIARARRLPSLRVGLHLVVTNGKPLCAPPEIRRLVDSRGELPGSFARAGIGFFFSPETRRQLEMEIRAQFRAFDETGLRLDHVNCHNHMHLHPAVCGILLKTGREYGLRAVRFPYEPALPDGRLRARFERLFLSPWHKLLKYRLGKARLKSNDFIFGMTDTGAMTFTRVLNILKQLPEGVTELYFHPGSRACPELDRVIPNYRYREEYEALVCPEFGKALKANGIERVCFSDL